MKQLMILEQEVWMEKIPEEFLAIEPAVFETLRTYKGKIYWLDQHLDRIQRSAAIMNIPYSLETQTLKKQVLEVRDQNYQGADLRIRIQLNSTGYIITADILELWPDEYYTKGITIADTAFERPNPEAKYTTSVYNNLLLQAEDLGAQEMILFDGEENLREGNRTNVFAVFGNTIVTPKEKILKGVMRQQVIIWAQELGLHIKEGAVSREELMEADEILLTNALKGIVPVGDWGEWKRKTDTVYKSINKVFDNNRD